MFSDVAPAFLAKGLPVIPLRPNDKMPVIDNWSVWHDQMPDESIQADWIHRYKNCNIGLVLGKQSNIMIIDIDTEDPAIIKMIDEVLPKTPYWKIGAKGKSLFYKFNGVPTFRIKNLAGETVVECLSTRTQTAIPPSIHPKTMEPYWESMPLLEAIPLLPHLSSQVEALLRGALNAGGIELSTSGWTRISDWVPSGARDTAMTGAAGIMASAVTRGEKTLYEAIESMRFWATEQVEKVVGDEIDVNKGITNLLKFLSRDVIQRRKALPKGWDEGFDDEQLQKMGLSFTDDNMDWSQEDMLKYLHTNFERFPPESAERMVGIRYILEKISRSNTLDSLGEGIVLKYMIDSAGIGLTMTSLRRGIKDLTQGEIQGRNHTEIAEATLADLREYHKLVFNSGRFWWFTGSHWTEYPVDKIMNHIAQNYGATDMGKRSSDHSGVLRTMQNLATADLKMAESGGVNFANGLLTPTGRLLPHDAAYGMTYTLPFRYMPDESTRAPRFFEFLERAWGRDPDYKQKIEALQEAIWITMFGMATTYQRAFLFKGPGSTGKTTLLNIILNMMPDDARCTISPDMWGDKFSPVGMAGKLINYCGELSEKKLIDGQKFKEIVDGSPLQAQYKGQDSFTLHPRAAHWFASNYLPKTSDGSSGFNRRWLIFNFNYPLKDTDARVLNLADAIIAEEREAIAAWVMSASSRMKDKTTLTIPASHEDEIRDAAAMNNSVRLFLDESPRVRIADGSKTSRRISENQLLLEYRSFCFSGADVRPVGSQIFRQKMKDLAFEKGFTVHIARTEHGSQEIFYDGLTVAK